MNKIDILIITIYLFVCAIFLSPLLKTGIYQSQDGENHVARFGAYYKAFADGQIPPRWAGDLNYGYGTPVLNFFYPLPGYVASLLHVFGISLEDAFKIIIGVSFILAPFTFYLWASELFRKHIAIIAAILYGFAPYHFLDLYVRGDIGEILSFVFLPLVLLMFEKIVKRPTIVYIFLGAIFYGLFVLSHNIMSLLFTPTILAYVFLRSRLKKEILVYIALSIFFGLSLTSFFWLPAIYESRYINIDTFVGTMFKYHFPTISQLIFSTWGFGPDVRKVEGLSPQIGLLHLLMVLVSIVLLLRNKLRRNPLLLFWLCTFFLAVFMTISLSSWLWNILPFIKQFQFPWKFSVLSSFSASVLTGIVLTNFRNSKPYVLLIVILILLSLPFIRVSGFSNRIENYYLSFPSTTYYHGEATTRWIQGEPTSYPISRIEIISGKGTIKDIERNLAMHTFSVVANTDLALLDNTIYFPGWQVKVDNKKTPIEFQDINHRGLITFSVPSGIHHVEVGFTESPIRLFSDIISTISVILVTGICILQKRVNRILVKL